MFSVLQGDWADLPIQSNEAMVNQWKGGLINHLYLPSRCISMVINKCLGGLLVFLFQAVGLQSQRNIFFHDFGTWCLSFCTSVCKTQYILGRTVVGMHQKTQANLHLKCEITSFFCVLAIGTLPLRIELSLLLLDELAPPQRGFPMIFWTKHSMITPPKFNIAPEKWWLEDYFPFGKVDFSGAMLNFAGGIRAPHFKCPHILTKDFLLKDMWNKQKSHKGENIGRESERAIQFKATSSCQPFYVAVQVLRPNLCQKCYLLLKSAPPKTNELIPKMKGDT